MSDTGQGPTGPSDPVGGTPGGWVPPTTPTEAPAEPVVPSSGGWVPPTTPTEAPASTPVEPVVPSSGDAGNTGGVGGAV